MLLCSVPTYPKVKCDRVTCPDPYFHKGLIPNAPPDPTKGIQDPIGTGGPSYVEYGTCPVDRAYPDEINDVQEFSFAQLYSYDLFTHGFFFWNFRTELESRWDYQRVSLYFYMRPIDVYLPFLVALHPGCTKWLDTEGLGFGGNEVKD